MCPSVPAVFQWLKQIEGTEAALTQKMLDLEKEKVKDLALWEAGGWKGFRQFPSQDGFSCLFACIYLHAFLNFAFAPVAVLGNCHPLTYSSTRSVIHFIRIFGGSLSQAPCQD